MWGLIRKQQCHGHCSPPSSAWLHLREPSGAPPVSLLAGVLVVYFQLMESWIKAPFAFREVILRQQCHLVLVCFESIAFFVFLAVSLSAYPSDGGCGAHVRERACMCVSVH